MSKSIYEDWICLHSKYKSPLDQLVDEIEMALDASPPFVFPLLGHSRTGKTTLLKDVETYFANRLSPTGHPLVLRLSMASAASNESLAARIIKKLLNDEIRSRSSRPLSPARAASTRSRRCSRSSTSVPTRSPASRPSRPDA